MKKETVTQKVVADHLGISTRMVRKLLEMGVFVKEPDGKLDLDKCRMAYLNHLREQAAGRKSDHGSYDLISERARLAKAQADKTELEVEIMQETLLPAENVLQEWQACISACRAKLLAIPSKLAFQISGLKEPSEVERFLKRTIGETLMELSDYDPPTEPDPSESIKDVDAPARADSKPVGRRTSKAKSGSKQRTRKVGNRSRPVSKGDDGRSK